MNIGRGIERAMAMSDATWARHANPLSVWTRVPVLPDDTAESLAARVLEQEHILYPMVLRRFAAGDRHPVMLP